MGFLRSLVILFLMLGSALSGSLTQGDELLNRLTPQGYVNDYTGIFSDHQRRVLEHLIAELEQKTGAEIAVAVLPSLEGGEIDDFSNRLFEKWGIGKKGEDNGLLILMASQERQIRVEVGYGLESILPDARVGRILDQDVLPFFRQSRFAEGLTAGTVRLSQIIAAHYGVSLEGGSQSTGRPATGKELTLFQKIVGGVVALALLILFIKNPWLFLLLLHSSRRGRGGGFGGGGFGGGSFGGFGGGLSGGGGAGRSW